MVETKSDGEGQPGRVLTTPTDSKQLMPEPSNDARMVGLRDAVLSGWYSGGGEELYRGFAISADDVVLDVGCGDGANAVPCGKRGAHVIIADIEPEKVQATLKRLRETPARDITPVIGDASALPLPDGYVTKVIASEVIEHVDDPAQFLRELVRVGRSGAQYLLTVPDPVGEGLQRQLAPRAFFEKPTLGHTSIAGLCAGHLRTIQRDEFERMVTDAGLGVEHHGYYGFYWSIWFALFWICDVDFSTPEHPLLDKWRQTWRTLLDTPGGSDVKRVLDEFMPKSQIILARKP